MIAEKARLPESVVLNFHSRALTTTSSLPLSRGSWFPEFNSALTKCPRNCEASRLVDTKKPRPSMFTPERVRRLEELFWRTCRRSKTFWTYCCRFDSISLICQRCPSWSLQRLRHPQKCCCRYDYRACSLYTRLGLGKGIVAEAAAGFSTRQGLSPCSITLSVGRGAVGTSSTGGCGELGTGSTDRRGELAKRSRALVAVFGR